MATTQRRGGYDYRVSAIQNLIEHLDEELKQMSTKVWVPKTNVNANTANNAQKNSLNAYRTPIMSLTRAPKIENIRSTNYQFQLVSSTYNERVLRACQNRRIFMVSGNFHSIRRALRTRGWIEKLPSNFYPRIQALSESTIMSSAKPGNDYEKVLLSKRLHNCPAFFIWQYANAYDWYKDVLPYRNRIRRNRELDFTTKVGLIGCSEQNLWNRDNSSPGMNYPRFYRLGSSAEERIAFISDYFKTQCRSLILYLWESRANLQDMVDEDNGSVPGFIVRDAVKYVEDQLNDKMEDEAEKSQAELQVFINFCCRVMFYKEKLKATADYISERIQSGINAIKKLQITHPDYKWDGQRNLWILKPGYQCRGTGIVIRRGLDDILEYARRNTSRWYIVQKYIEKPLLIFNTKFDIRVYMLVTISSDTLTVWLYKDFYLKFSSQQFSLSDLRESIHLTNHTVQRKYKNDINRDRRLPPCNMWNSIKFLSYLRYVNSQEDIWYNKILPGFEHSLSAAIKASFDCLRLVENSFELFGCDFMLDESFNPILLEINATPDMSPSTDVTAFLCPNVLTDLVKVVVDYSQNSEAPTGHFDQIMKVDFKANKSKPVAYVSVSGLPLPIGKPLVNTAKTSILKKSTNLPKASISAKPPSTVAAKRSSTATPKKLSTNASKTVSNASKNKDIKRPIPKKKVVVKRTNIPSK
ncbi:tubulin glycylase 3B-like [Teleopsis dalmanni]|uniref:tubulin glycylase 3B-like n=1 Tax=Teleopsis dalmanni TaxID=139649 RepID=UPI0018CE12D1|nr:tubulin glycylase 3B-like [Teleopsis dalmanni]